MVKALQTVQTRTYEVGSVTANGAFSLTLPVTLASDGTVIGQYRIEAKDTTTGAIQTTPVDITTSSVTNLSFSF